LLGSLQIEQIKAGFKALDSLFPSFSPIGEESSEIIP
jgi:hypothetical protein